LLPNWRAAKTEEQKVRLRIPFQASAKNCQPTFKTSGGYEDYRDDDQKIVLDLASSALPEIGLSYVKHVIQTKHILISNTGIK
jgi:hypothetical protein